MAEFALTIIGSGSALPMHGRHPSAQVIQYDQVFCLIDCGESTQMRLRDAGVKSFKIEIILISHLHGDHVFGLPGLLSSFTHLHRTEPLTVFGPVGIKGLLTEIIRYTELKINYPLSIIESTPMGLNRIWGRGNLEILTFPLYHRIACNGYLFRESSSSMKLQKERLESYSLTIEQLRELKKGNDIEVNGTRIPNRELTHGNASTVSYAYCSDTRFDQRIISSIRDVSVLYHETTFRNDMISLAEQTGHTTAGDAGRIASAARASCLITGHYSSRYKEVSEILREAGEYFPYVLEAVEGKRYNLRSLACGSEPNEHGENP